MFSKRPDLTPAQIVSGIPIIAELLHAFGVYTISQPQQDSLAKAATWGFVLIGADAGVRAVRNIKDGKVEAAAISAPSVPLDVAHGTADDGTAVVDPEVDTISDEDLPSDDEEAGEAVVQPSPQP